MPRLKENGWFYKNHSFIFENQIWQYFGLVKIPQFAVGLKKKSDYSVLPKNRPSLHGRILIPNLLA